MLIIKAFVNEKEIDEIHIWNTGNCMCSESEIYAYKIVKPEGYKLDVIFHAQSDGYMALLKQAIDIINPIGD